MIELNDSENIKDDILNTAIRCFNCNFCFSTCPLKYTMPGFATNGPSGIMQSIYYAVKWDLFHEKDEILELVSLCTTCNSCVLTCKECSTGTPILDVIEKGRMLLIDKGIGPLPTQRNPLKSLFLRGNPYEKDAHDRLNWLGDLDVKKLPHESAEVLYFVGCTASYDPELQNIARSMVKLFNFLQVDFGILEEEICCGCVANRLGDKDLFAEIAEKNKDSFLKSGVTKIVTTSPHCFHAFSNEYEHPKEISYTVQHYTQYLYELIKGGKFQFTKKLDYVVTYHDPCYLSKHNGIYEEPRALINALDGVKFVEMKDNKENSLCCGGGGGRMWADFQEERKLGTVRVEQALDAGANIIVVACPWCQTMLRDGIKDLGQEEAIKVMDIAELLLEAIE